MIRIVRPDAAHICSGSWFGSQRMSNERSIEPEDHAAAQPSRRRVRLAAGLVATTLVAIVAFVLMRRAPDHRQGPRPSTDVRERRVTPSVVRADRCDGEDDDRDGTVDEACDCAAGFAEAYAPVPFTSVKAAATSPDGSLLLVGSGGISRYDGRAFRTLTRSADAELVHAFVGPDRTVSLDVQGRLRDEREDGRPFIGTPRWNPALQDVREVHGSDFAHALTLVTETLYRLAPTVTKVEGIPEHIETFDGDARGFVAFETGGTIHHHDGTSTRTSRLDGAPPDALFHRAPNATFAVGSDHRVSRWDGSTWTTMLTRPGERLSLVTGNARLLFVQGHDLATDAQVVHRFDGRAWTHVTFAPDDPITSLHMVGDVLHAVSDGALLAFDGTKFVRVLERHDGAILAIHAHSARSVFAIAMTERYFTSLERTSTVLHYDGDRWRTIHSAPDVRFAAVYAARDDLAFVGGTSGDTPDDRGVLLTCDESGCAPFASGGESLPGIDAVWAESETSVVLAARGGVMHHFEGGRFVRRDAPGPIVRRIEGRSARDLYAPSGTGDASARGRGTALHFDGAAWTLLRGSSDAHDLYDVAMLSSTAVAFGGGNDGYLESGSSLFVVEDGRQRRIRVADDMGVVALDVVGADILTLGRTQVERDGGATWGRDSWVLRVHTAAGTRTIASDPSHMGHDMLATSPRNVFVVGTGMSVMHRCGPVAVTDLPELAP